jgi:hypothetical protein
MQDVAARFWSKVTKADGCWRWNGRGARGYGTFWCDGRYTMAHRMAWRLTKGPIPAGAHVLHHCDTPGCVNPDHLFLGTHADNMADMASKHRFPSGERHWWRKLTADQVQQIRSRVAAGAIQRRVARSFGISPATVCMIVARRIWRG